MKKLDPRFFTLIFGFALTVVLFLVFASQPKRHIVLLIDKSKSTWTNNTTNLKDPRLAYRQMAFAVINKVIQAEWDARVSVITVCNTVEVLNPGSNMSNAVRQNIADNLKIPCTGDGTFFARGLQSALSEVAAFNSNRVGFIFLTDWVVDNDIPSEKSKVFNKCKALIVDKRIKWILVGGVKSTRIADIRNMFGVLTLPNVTKLTISPTLATVNSLQALLEKY